MDSQLVSQAREFVLQLLKKELDAVYTYHRLEHTVEVVSAAEKLAGDCDLNPQDKARLLIAAWFHDTGYVKGSKEHESRSIEYVEEFLLNHDVSRQDISVISGIIRSTEMLREPEGLLQSLMKDADLSHLAAQNYDDYATRLRSEWASLNGTVVDDVEWIRQNIGFMNTYGFHSEAGKARFGPGKHQNLQKLNMQLEELSADSSASQPLPSANVAGDPQESPSKGEGGGKKKKRKKKESRFSNNPDRGVETMFRVTLKNHLALSQVADNKANIMLSINAIIISVVMSTLLPQIDENSNLLVPLLILTSVCVVSIVFATISTIPKVTSHPTTRKDVEDRNVNLLFFGNFHMMELEDYMWGMEEMVKDPDFLYGSMVKDLYFLGKVLNKKYTYLRYTYIVFMTGMIASVLAFVIAML